MPFDLPESGVESVGRLLKTQLDAALAAQEDRMTRITDLELQMTESTTVQSEVPFEGASEVHIPLAEELIDTAHVLTNKIIQSSRPRMLVTPHGELDEEKLAFKRQVEEVLEWAFDCGGLDLALYESVAAAFIGGTGLVRVTWRSESLMKRIQPFGRRKELPYYFRGPVYEYIERQDFVYWPTTARSLKQAKFCGHRFYLRLQEIDELSKAGEYVEDAKDKLMMAQGQVAAHKLETGEEAGISVQTPGSTDPLDTVVELWELYVKHPEEQGGPETLWHVVFAKDAGVVLKLVRYPYWHDRPCYVPIYVKRRPGRFDGRSMAMQLEGLNAEADALQRMFIDANTMNILGVYAASPSTLMRLKGREASPGAILPEDMPNGIRMLKEVVPLPNVMPNVEFLVAHGERLTGLSPTMMGVPLQERRTATEVAHYQGAGAAKVDDLVRCIFGQKHPDAADGIREIALQTLWLLYQYSKEWIGRPGSPAYDFDPVALLAGFTLEGHGTSLLSMPESIRSACLQLYALFSADPVFQDPVRRLRLMRRIAELSRAGTDFLPTEEELAEQVQQQQMGQMFAQAMGEAAGKIGEASPVALEAPPAGAEGMEPGEMASPLTPNEVASPL